MSLATQPTNVNFLSTVNFRFTIRKAPLISFFAVDAKIPSVRIDVAEQQTPFVVVPRPGTRVKYDNFSLTFRVDEDMRNYTELYNWMSALGHREGFDAYKNLTNGTSVDNTAAESDCTLLILDSAKSPNIEITFRDAFPVYLSDIDFTVQTPDVRYASCTVEFAFRDFTLTKL